MPRDLFAELDEDQGPVDLLDGFDDRESRATALDYLKGAAAGSNKLLSGVGYIAEKAGADDLGGALREQGDSGAAYWTDKMTEGGKVAAKSQVFEDDPDSITGIRMGDKWGQALMMGAAQSAPTMLAAAIPGGLATSAIQGLARLGLAGGAGATIPLLAGTAAPVGMASSAIARIPSAIGFGAAEGVTAGAMNAADLKTSIEGMSFEELAKSPVFVNLAQQHGPEAARKMLAEQASADVFRDTSISTGTIGAITGGGALAQAYQKATAGAKGGIVRQMGKGAGAEAFQETPQSGAETYIQNVAEQKYLDPSIDTSRGVLSSALSGGAIGGLTGGVFGAGGAMMQQKQADQALQDITRPDATTDEAIASFHTATDIPMPNIMPRDMAQGGLDISAISRRNDEAMFRESLAEQGQQRQADINELEALINDETADINLRREALVSLQAQKREALDNAFRGDTLALPSPNDPTDVLRVDSAGAVVPETRQQRIEAERARIRAMYRPSGNVDERGINVGAINQEEAAALAADSGGIQGNQRAESVPDTVALPDRAGMGGVAGGVAPVSGSNLPAGTQSAGGDAVATAPLPQGETSAPSPVTAPAAQPGVAAPIMLPSGKPFASKKIAEFSLTKGKHKGLAGTHRVTKVNGGFAITEKPPRKPAKPVSVDTHNHTLLQAIAIKGVDAADPLANDLRKSLGLSDGKNMQVNVPGRPPMWLFRKGGMRLDTIAGDLSQSGEKYLDAHDRQEMLDKLFDDPGYMTPEGRAELAQREYEEQQAEQQATNKEKLESTIAARNIEDETIDAEIDWILANGRVMSEEEADAFNSEYREAQDAEFRATREVAENDTRGIEAVRPADEQEAQGGTRERQPGEDGEVKAGIASGNLFHAAPPSPSNKAPFGKSVGNSGKVNSNSNSDFGQSESGGVSGISGINVPGQFSSASTNSDTTLNKGSIQSAGAYTDFVGDIIKRYPGLVNGYSSLDVKSQGVVKSVMRDGINNDQIFKSIIKTIPVDVVNMFIGQKLSSNALLNKKAMLFKLDSSNTNVFVLGQFIDSLVNQWKANNTNKQTNAEIDNHFILSSQNEAEIAAAEQATAQALRDEVAAQESARRAADKAAEEQRQQDNAANGNAADAFSLTGTEAVDRRKQSAIDKAKAKSELLGQSDLLSQSTQPEDVSKKDEKTDTSDAKKLEVLKAQARGDVTGDQADALKQLADAGEHAAVDDVLGGQFVTPKIEDFGEHIVGAKKEYAQAYKDKMAAAKDMDVLAEPLSKSWPEPDYQKLIDAGADPHVVGLVRSMRDEIPNKPGKSYKQKTWASQVSGLRDTADQLLNDKAFAEKFIAEMKKAQHIKLDDAINGRAELYVLVGHEKSLKGVYISRAEYSVYNGQPFNPAKIIWEVARKAKATVFGNMPTVLGSGTTRQDAIDAFMKAYASIDTSAKDNKTKFEIYADRYAKAESNGQYFIGKKVGRNVIHIKDGIDTVKEARAYIAAHNEELTAILEAKKAVPKERYDINQPRVGQDMRNGQDVTPEMFAEAFSFRGVQFGNYVEGKRRQKDLNDAYDALMDLAAVLDIPPKALSLNGELGLAFGARGSGGVNPASAHYESGHVVINLTKGNGAGSLAHEWWHSLDSYFSRMAGKKNDFATDRLDVSLAARDSAYQFKNDGIRKEMIDSFGAVVKAVNSTAIKARSRSLDNRRTKEYWGTGIEMSARAFERYVIAKLHDSGFSNDYLANVVSEEYWNAADALGIGEGGSYPYPTESELPAIRSGFDHFFQTIETKETENGVALFSRRATPATGITEQSLRAAFTRKFPQLSRALDAMLKRGNESKKGGVVLIQPGEDIAAVFADKTGMSLEDARKSLQMSVAQTNTPAFKKWFGDSKVVDTNGDPLVVYHGSRNKFTVFDYSKIGEQGRGEGAGFYFTNNKDVASGYGNPMGVYLSIRKPLAYDAAPFSKTVVQKIVKRVSEIEAESEGSDIADGFLANFGDVRSEGLQAVLREAANLILDEATALDQISGIVGSGVNPKYVNIATHDVTGHDGVIAKGFSNAGDESNNIYVAFFHEQIKSTANRGTFDPNNPDIRYSKEGKAQAFYDPASGLTFLVAENLDPDTAANVLLHEAVHGNQRDTVDAAGVRLLTKQRKLSGGKLREVLDEAANRMVAAGAAQWDGKDLNITDIKEAAPYIVEVVAGRAREAGFSIVDGKFMDFVDSMSKTLGKFIRDFVASIRASMLRYWVVLKNPTVDDLVAYAEASMKRAARGDVVTSGNVVSGSDAMRNKALQEGLPLFSEKERSKLLQAWKLLAENDALFQYPVSESKDMEQIFSEVAPDVVIEHSGGDADLDDAWIVYQKDDSGEPIRSNPGFVLMYKDGSVELNVYQFGEGKKGSQVYSAVGNYAFNNGLKFKGDRLGITETGLFRRLENMISLALKFGTTDFMQPHPEQLSKMGIDWKDGQTDHNLEQMLKASYNDTVDKFPKIKDIYYDFDNGQFRDSSGNEVVIIDPRSEDPGKRFSSASRPGQNLVEEARTAGLRVGEATLKRAALSNTFLREETSSAVWGGVSEFLRRWGSGEVVKDFVGVAYSKSQEELRFSRKTPIASGQAVDKLNAAIEAQDGIKDAFSEIEFDDGGLRAALQKVSKRFDIVYVRPNNDAAAGIHGIQHGGRIYINPHNGEYSFIHLAGHEILHQIRKSAPDAYEFLASEARKSGMASEAYQRKLSESGIIESLDNSEEELLADFTGDALADPKFLKLLAKDNPTAFKQLLNVVITWLKQAANRLKLGGFGSSEYVRDVNDLRGYLWDVLDAYSKADDVAAIDGVDAPKFSRKTVVGDSGRQYTQEQKAAMDRTGSIVTNKTIKETVSSLWQDAGKKMAQGIVDQFRPVRDIDAHAYTLMRLSKGATGAFEAFMHHGKLSLRDGAFDSDTSGGVLETVFNPLGKESTDFLRWIAGNRAERLASEDKENLFSPDDIAAFKSLSTGTTDFDYTLPSGKATRSRALIYSDSLRKFNEFNKNVLDMAEQSGLIDPESRKLWEHEFYVPFYRMADENDGGVRGMNIKQGVVRQEAFKKLKGGDQKMNDLLANTLMNWAHLIDASAKNRAATATLQTAEKIGAARKAVTGEKKTVWHMDGGKRIEYKVDDPYLLEAINGLEYAGLRGPAMDAMSKAKHWLTIGVTASPFFKVRNLIRDSVQAIATASNSDLSYNPIANVKKGFKLTDRASQEYVSALAGGGLIRFGTMLEGNEASRARQLIKQGASDQHILDNESKVRAFYDKYLEPAISAYNEIGNRGEEINRMALYDALIKNGIDHATASLMARDLMDFSMQGTWSSVRFLTQIVPFMNARLQGIYKLGRAAKEDKQRFAIVVGGVAMASLALLAAYHDDDDWKKREDWDRDNYWWFKLGGIAFRIPKPFEVGAIGTLAERSAEFMFDDEMTGKRFASVALNLTSNQLAMNPVPQAFKPIIDLYANKDSFTGRQIESMGMERLAPDYRFKQSTSMIARGLSTAGNALTGDHFMSPVQIDHVIRAYFGWLGATAVSAADIAVRSASNEPTKPALDYWKTATGSIISSTDGAHSRYVSQMYDQARELEQAYGTWRNLTKEGKREEAQEYREDHKDELSRYRRVEAVKKQVSKINERIRIIERSTMDADTKRDKINELRKRQDDIARRLAA